jgi:hypothetical protein
MSGYEVRTQNKCCTLEATSNLVLRFFPGHTHTQRKPDQLQTSPFS